MTRLLSLTAMLAALNLAAVNFTWADDEEESPATARSAIVTNRDGGTLTAAWEDYTFVTVS